MRNHPSSLKASGRFPTTSWTLIVAANKSAGPGSREALNMLCNNYWYPICAFYRRKGLDREQAKDCTQGFFSNLVTKAYLADIESSKGNFRSFLLAAAGHFFSNWLDAGKALKRGGGHRIISLEKEDADYQYRVEPADSLTPEAIFEYHWATSVLQRTLQRLRSSYLGDDFDELKPFLIGDAGRGESSVSAKKLGMSEGAFKVATHRLRKRYREALRAEISQTVSDPVQVDGEIRYLLTVLSRGEKAL